MKVLHFNGTCLELQERPLPVPGPNEALIRVLYAGICNTDMEILKGYMDFRGVPGHEFVGIVEQAPYPAWTGKTVVGEINIACGKCNFCVRGIKNHCANRQVLGIAQKDGVFAEYCTLPVANLHVVPSFIPKIEAVFVEPLAAACEILEQLQIFPDYRILVLGDGKLAQLIAQVMHLQTKNLLVVGKSSFKLDIMRKMGIETILLEDFHPEKNSFHVVVEATGNKSGWQMALENVRPQGYIVLKSTYTESFQFNTASIVVNEITLIGSRCGPFARALSLLERNEIEVEPLISSIYSLANFEQAFEKSKQKDVLKVLIQPTENLLQ